MSRCWRDTFFDFSGFSSRAAAPTESKKNRTHSLVLPPLFSFFNKRTFSRSFEDVERTSVYANYLALRWF